MSDQRDATKMKTNQSLDDTLGEIRSKGWRVAAHYEFELNDQWRTFWLFTHACGKFIEGQGAADSEILVLQLALGDVVKHLCD